MQNSALLAVQPSNAMPDTLFSLATAGNLCASGPSLTLVQTTDLRNRCKRKWASGHSSRSGRQESACRCQGWFDFSTESGGGSGGKRRSNGGSPSPPPPSFGDFAVLAHLQRLGCGDHLRPPRQVHFSGCINESYAFHCTGGDYFVKLNRHFKAAEMFEGEAEALRLIGSTATLRVPKALAWGDLEGGSFLILEHLRFRPFGMMQQQSQEALGRDLARLHLAAVPMAGFGFPRSTRLGVVPLDNDTCDSWPKFFVERRLSDRLERAFAVLGGDASAELRQLAPRLLAASEAILGGSAGGASRRSLLHGDLWVGNAGLLPDGQVAAFDPAAFVGHSEFDLAFEGWGPVEGFPGFSPAFYGAYHEVLPKEAGFGERHRVYQLFHLLNHLLIYGGEYYRHAMEAAQEICRL